MQTMLICTTDIFARLVCMLRRATRLDLPLTTGMAAVLLCTVHSACTLDLSDPRLHISQASKRDRLIMHLTRLIFSRGETIKGYSLTVNPKLIDYLSIFID